MYVAIRALRSLSGVYEKLYNLGLCLNIAWFVIMTCVTLPLASVAQSRQVRVARVRRSQT